MSHHSFVAVFSFDAPVNQTPAHKIPVHKIPAQISQLRTMGKMATGTPLIYGPALLLLLAACGNGNNVTKLNDSPQDRDAIVTINGGAGIDTLTFANSIEAITIDLRAGVDDEGYYVMAPFLSPGEESDAFERGTKFKNFERIAGSPKDDTFYGADDADFFFLAGDGDDVLISGKGSDTLHAGPRDNGGFNVVDYSRAEGGIRVDLNDLDDDNFATITIDHADWKDDRVKYVENVIGSNHDDTFSGEVDVTNYFTGGTGRDVFYIDEWVHNRGDAFNYDVVIDFVVGTDKIGFRISSAILDAYFVEGNEDVGGFFGSFGLKQEVNDADNKLIIKRIDVTILEIDNYSGTEVLDLDLTNFTFSLDVA